ncbi:hypothetical protein [Sphingobacterium sp. 1.A.5]|jgi:hypothetical protein|uniref:hypothetical protein n=1 Tax=Sphingobacterium sp. 1.A.5 TaxID=2044604 RepID=UPI000C0BBF77|nr:hypothetical protein [Sphingobacterium sp. 1.A.5]
MKKKLFFALAIASLGITFSCSSDDDTVTPTPEPGKDIEKTGLLNANETWTAGNIYILKGKVVVAEGTTLTIEPGTIIKGAQGTEANASALVVDQGAKLIANGTADKPIIFTSVDDNIKAGEKAGTNLTEANVGLWGGVIVLGKAPISVAGDVKTAQIEGIPANESYGQYGGDDAADNSGSLKYISIRHGGITIGQDNEINGLTLGGVGSGTVIDNIEIVGNQDDGIEWFGGSVNATNLLTWASGDDGLDVDQAYSGTIKNALVIKGKDSGSALELDGPEGSKATEKSFTMEDITINNNNNTSLIADLRDGVIVNLKNILAYNLGAGSSLKINGADSQAELKNGRITFSNWEVLLPQGLTLDKFITDAKGEEAKFVSNAKALNAIADAKVGANVSVFDWTFAKSKKAF